METEVGGSENRPEVVTQPAVTTTSPRQRRKGFLLLAVVVLMGASFYLASSVVPRVLVYLTRAANTPGAYSLTNSYIFGSPLVAEGNGNDKIRVMVYLQDAKGRGVPQKQIELTTKPGEGTSGTPQIEATQPVTDNIGRAVFEVSSSAKGQFVIGATIDGLSFPQTVTLTFR